MIEQVKLALKARFGHNSFTFTDALAAVKPLFVVDEEQVDMFNAESIIHQLIEQNKIDVIREPLLQFSE